MRLLSYCAPMALAVLAAASFAEDGATSAPATAAAPDAAVVPETVTVTATRVEARLAEVASDVSVITAKDLAASKLTTVADALRDLPGVTVSRSGGSGQATSVFLRGAKSEHTLVMIDGVPVNDPSTPAGTFDFARMPTENIERIEVLRGPQGALYGSNAIGGVINIVTKSGGPELSGFLTLEAGSFETYRESAGLRGGDKVFKFAVTGSREDSGGISAVPGTEPDGYQRTSGSVKLSLDPADAVGFDFISRASDAQTAIDGFNNGTFKLTDLNNKQNTQEYYNQLQTRVSLYDHRWEQKIALAYNKIDRTNQKSPGFGDAERTDDAFHGDSWRLDWQNDFYFVENNILTVGADFQQESAKSSTFSSLYGRTRFDRDELYTVGLYAQNQFKMFKPFYLTIGGRVDNYESFGTEPTYRIAPSYVIEQTDTTLRASYGTGFKAPTLYQLQSPYGNPSLQPERSRGWDAGFEQRFAKGAVTLNGMYFYNDFDELIDFNFVTSKYANIGSANSQGVETGAAWKVTNDLRLTTQYTYTHTHDNSTGLPLLRRPRHSAGVGLDYSFLKYGHLNVGADYTGERADVNPNTFARIVDKEYWWVHGAVSWDLTENLQVFARVENAINAHYQEVAGYSSPGFGAYAGVKLSF